MRKKAGFALRALTFLLLAALLWGYATYVLTPKHDYGICPMITFYTQRPGQIDLLTIGTSLAFTGVNTNVLWREYGIAAYDLCTAEQPFWISYYYLKEALKTQRPKLILLDAKPAMYRRSYSPRGRAILSTYGMKPGMNRFNALHAALEPGENVFSYALGLPEVHSNYRRTRGADFALPPDNGGRGASWKGYMEDLAVEDHQAPNVSRRCARKRINARQERFVRRILELAREEKLTLLLVAFPNPDYANDQPYYESLWAIADEYGIPHVDYNTVELQLSWGEDFADWQHLNLEGSVRFSRRLGQDLSGWYSLPDRRGDPAYTSWEKCAARWYQTFADYEVLP